MSIRASFNGTQIFSGTWQERVLSADDIWQQVQKLLAENAATLPQTPRRPDVRMIVRNLSGAEISFLNPGQHANGKPEIIPGDGDKTAAMIMLKGETLEAQYRNAKTLYDTYDLGNLGLTQDFLTDMAAGKLSALLDEAYGPAPFADQSDKLVPLQWTACDGACTEITPEKGQGASFGARAATTETVFHTSFNIYVAGTGTTPEMVESAGMCIAVGKDYKTGKETTRPIVPSVARVYYGAHFNTIPAVTVSPEGAVAAIDLKRAPQKGSSPRNPAR